MNEGAWLSWVRPRSTDAKDLAAARRELRSAMFSAVATVVASASTEELLEEMFHLLELEGTDFAEASRRIVPAAAFRILRRAVQLEEEWPEIALTAEDRGLLDYLLEKARARWNETD